jgi:adenylosuccinate synthase
MVDVVLGLQWGDEGKGKIADYLTPQYDIVCRFQGGPNAGHSLEFNGEKHVLNTIPSGIFHEGIINLIGNGVVIDPVKLIAEIRRVEAAGIDVQANLLISRKAHLILPTHRLLDEAYENAKGATRIGSTLRGIGPAYKEKIGRSNLRLGDIDDTQFEARYHAICKFHHQTISSLGLESFDLDALNAEFFAAVELLRAYKRIDSEYWLNEQLIAGKRILAEGAQGSMLDIDFGTYPYVTSSNTVSGGACSGLGLAPRHIGRVMGIFKAYCTRVGSGPFPTELHDETGELLRKNGREFGATTGRPRRCGWIDLAALRYAIMLSGVTDLIMMKSDVLSGMDTIRAGIAYSTAGVVSEQVPFDLTDPRIEPVYRDFPGWHEDITRCTGIDQLPATLRSYVSFLEQSLALPLQIISVGPSREQTIIRN